MPEAGTIRLEATSHESGGSIRDVRLKLKTINMQGRVREIYVGSQREAPMKSVPTAQAITGKGLAEDRYANGLGSYSK